MRIDVKKGIEKSIKKGRSIGLKNGQEQQPEGSRRPNNQVQVLSLKGLS